MTDITEAARMALEALEESVDLVRHEYATDWRKDLPSRKAQRDAMKAGVDKHEAAIVALRDALSASPPAPADTRVPASSASVAFSDLFMKQFDALAGNAASDIVKDAARLSAACAWEQAAIPQPAPADAVEREAFEAAMVEAGYHRPERGPFNDSQFRYERDQDRFVGWELARASLPSAKAVSAQEGEQEA